jgi:MscS family membrane protein
VFGRVTVTIFLFSAVISPAFAQLPARKQTPPPAASPAQTSTQQPPAEDALGRSTPYGSVTGFLSAAGHGDFARAAKYLDSQQSPQRKEELARQLKFVMDRGLKIDVNELDRTPEGRPDDMSQPDRESVGVARNGSENLDIVLERVRRGHAPLWLFSSVTLLSVPDFAAGLEAPWIERSLPKGLIERRPAGIPLYRWIFVPLSIVVILAAACIVVWLLGLAFGRSLRSTKGYSGVKLPRLVGPSRLLVFTLLVHMLSQVAPTLVARTLWTRVAALLAVVGFCWLLMRAVDTFAELMTRRMEQADARAKVAIVHLLSALSKPLIVAIGIVVILSLEGINTTAIITSLGVGGIAIAFAAQKTIENLFGTMMLVSDKPIRIGDTCRFAEVTGTVEAIGLRSTRVRTLDRTVVTIPNGQLASMSLENLSARDKFLFNHTIGLRYETTAEQLRFIVAEVRPAAEGAPQGGISIGSHPLCAVRRFLYRSRDFRLHLHRRIQ